MNYLLSSSDNLVPPSPCENNISTNLVPVYTIPAEEISADRNSPLGKARRTSNVFKGSWNDSIVVVKVLSKETIVDTLLDHYKTWQSLRHPHVLQVFGVSLIDTGPVIILQYFSNGDANAYLTSNPGADRAKIMLECALGMQYLHGRGLVHGSLKPTNILVAENGQVCIADYGMIEIAPSRSGGAHRYFSPEAWKGTISKASDVYAFAMSAYEIFFSTPPWGVLSEDLIYRFVTREGDRPDRLDSNLEPKGGLTDQLWRVIEAAWHQDAASRPTFSQIVKLWQGPSTDRSPDSSSPRSGSPSSSVSVTGSPLPNLFGSQAIMSEPAQRLSDMTSVLGVPPAYHERSMTRPFSACSNPNSSTMTESSIADNVHVVTRSASTSSSSLGNSHRFTMPRIRTTTMHSPSPSSPLTQGYSNIVYPIPEAASHSRRFLSADEMSITTGINSMMSPSTRMSRMPSIDEIESNHNHHERGSSSFRHHTQSSPSHMGRGSTYNGDTRWLSQGQPTIEANRMMSDTQSLRSNSQRSAPPHTMIGRNPVLLAKALHAEVTEGRKQEVIDDYLEKVRSICSRSDKEAQKLVTAGVVPTVLLLLQARAIDGVGLELVLVTLGILVCDPITANTVHRTNTATVLIEIISSSDSENVMALSVWCINRICRSADVASSLIKADLAGILIAKGLQGGLTSARLSAWCLGNLAYTDALAQTLASYDLITASVRHLKRITMNTQASTEDICAALYIVARMARSIPLSKSLIRAGCVPLVIRQLSTSDDSQILQWSARAVGCLMRPNGSDIAKILIDAGSATALARLPRVLPSDAIEPLASFAFSIQRFSCAEWGSGTRRSLVDAGVVDSLLAALRSAADALAYPQVHIELALAVSFLGDVGGSAIRKEIVKAGGIDILKRVGAAGRPDVTKTCNMAVTSITGNLWTRNAASAKTAMSHSWSGGCPEYQPTCPLLSSVEFEG